MNTACRPSLQIVTAKATDKVAASENHRVPSLGFADATLLLIFGIVPGEALRF